MTPRLMKYNPAFLTPEELVKSFVVRLTDLELILETIRHNTGASNQHILIIGPRGSGKTSLVLRTVESVRQDAERAPKWYPIVFGEDSYEVCSPGEFWLEALFHLGENTKLSRWQRTYEELRSEKDEIRLRERTLAQLMDFADEEGKRLLLVVENLNTILGQQINNDVDAWVLRHTLTNEPRLMLLGTATNRFAEIENSGKAMYDLFKLYELKPLNAEDCCTMWQAITGDELSENRVRPIEILTGGNPRLLSIIANFAAKTSFRELMQDLTQLVDDHTEYFKSHLDGLPPLERKVFVALADLWNPLTARQVAEAARVDVNTASSLLKRLISRGAVEVFEEKGRKKWYQVAERMYNIYHLMRRRGAPSSRIWAVVNFMIHFYESDHIIDIFRSITTEVCKPECEDRTDHYLACELLLQKIPSEELKEKIFGATPPQFLKMPDMPSTLRESFVCMQPLSEKRELEEAQKREQQIPTSPESHETAKLIALGDELRRNPDQVQEAEKAYRDAIRIDDNYGKAWVRLANLLSEETGRFDEAEAAYRRAIELKPDFAWAWAQLGHLLHKKLERFDEAEAAYRKAIELKPNVAEGWGLLGQLLHEKLERFDGAEAAYRKAIELKPDFAWAWAQLGHLLHKKLERFDEAEAAYRQALELKPDYAWAWGQLGLLLHEKLERVEEAEAAYRQAIELEPNVAEGWGLLGQLLYEKLGRFDEAEAAYRQAIELEADYAWAWVQLGQLLHEELGRFDEAEAAYRKAIELQPDYAWARGQLGLLLHEKLGRFDEAEAAYRKALELTEVSGGWAKLGQLLHEKLGRFDEAEAAYRKAIELQPDYAWAWAHLGQLLHEKLGRFEAEAAYRKAIELQPDYAWAWAHLGQLLHEGLGRYEEAQKAYLTALEIDDKDYTVWEYLIKLQMQKLVDADAALKTLNGYLQSAQRSPASLINVACTIVEQHWEKFYPQVDAWMQEATEKAPEDWPNYLALAYIQGAMGNWQNALCNASQYLRHTEILPDALGRVTDIFIEAAAAGYPEEALQALKKTSWASHLEPLVTGLQIYLGEEPTIAKEILEVGRDVAKRIEDRKRKISQDLQKAKA